MKSFITGALIGVGALLAGATVAPLAAQQSPAFKIAYVNTREILMATPGYTEAEATYKREYETFELEVEKIRVSLDSAAEDFQRAAAMMDATKQQARRKALEDKAKQADEKVRTMRDQIDTRERDLIQPIQQRINSVIEGIRAAGGYAIIFDVSSPANPIVTADPALNLTQRVIQQLKSGD